MKRTSSPGEHPAHRKKIKRHSLKNIQQLFFRTQLVFIITIALFLGIAGTLINLHFETRRRDQNLENISEAIACSPLLMESIEKAGSNVSSSKILIQYLDSLESTLDKVDAISVVTTDLHRLYHSNHTLIGSRYDGTIPVFTDERKDYYVSDDTGPSGNQRRAYAAIYNENGDYIGFVITVMLRENIHEETLQTLLIFGLITIGAILVELLVSVRLSEKIKQSLLGYEPDVFKVMYQMRDNILESLDEGILAIDRENVIQFINHPALEMLGIPESMEKIIGNPLDMFPSGASLSGVLKKEKKEFNIRLNNENILLDRIPIKEDGTIVGTIGILHNREEYTRLMEDLSGTRYLVDSMRANNHDFTNKLHVILGLIQMEMYQEATEYIENISLLQRETIGKIMKAVDEPSIAALLIGKTARASELNVRFILREGFHYAADDMALPSEMLVTVIGNLIDNAFDAMNNDSTEKELLFGIFSRPGAVLITVDDTGTGIEKTDLEHIYENGFSTKGESRGTGLYQVKSIVEGLGGTIRIVSQPGVGTSFSISFTKETEI